MSVLVTGAAGFIGRRLAGRLHDAGEDVRALILPGEATDGLEGCQVIEGDITDPATVNRITDGVSRVYHLAAIVTDWGDEADFVAVNVDGTRNVLEGAAAANCQRVLMVSSIVVYGWQMHTSVCDEVATPREYGVGAYSRTKRSSEELALDYHAFGRVPVTIVRPGNVFGPGSAVWVDELINVMRSTGIHLIGDGEGDALLAYVDNVVEVIMRAATAPIAAGRIYNAADGDGITWRRYLLDLAEIAGLSSPKRTIPASVALAIASAMEQSWRVLGKKSRPLMTREAVTILASRQPMPIQRAIVDLGYQPQVSYGEAMKRVADYVNGGII